MSQWLRLEESRGGRRATNSEIPNPWFVACLETMKQGQ